MDRQIGSLFYSKAQSTWILLELLVQEVMLVGNKNYTDT